MFPYFPGQMFLLVFCDNMTIESIVRDWFQPVRFTFWFELINENCDKLQISSIKSFRLSSEKSIKMLFIIVLLHLKLLTLHMHSN